MFSMECLYLEILNHVMWALSFFSIDILWNNSCVRLQTYKRKKKKALKIRAPGDSIILQLFDQNNGRVYFCFF